MREAGPETLVLLDPNCRPAAIRDPSAYRGRLHDVIRRADVVKASEPDLAYLEPGSRPIDTARAWLGLGPAVVLLTHGRDGATVLTAEGETLVPATRAAVVDTIGAGDAFGAAWLASWLYLGLGRPDLGRLDMATEATRFASVIAARTCERAGAEPPSAARLDAEWCLAPLTTDASTMRE